jgi:hypothetical protein
MFKISLGVSTVETNWDRDLSRNLDIMETFCVWKWWKVSTNWEISTRNIQKSTHFSIEIETNCREIMKFPGLDEFLDLDRDNLFENVDIFSTVETNCLTMSRLRLSIETTSRQIETPRLSSKLFLEICGLFSTTALVSWAFECDRCLSPFKMLFVLHCQLKLEVTTE